MELKQMEYFKTIADTGSITEAARKLNMTQPPLSVQIQLLEKELGVTLFERSHRQIHLTEAGRVFYDRCDTILNLSSAARIETISAAKSRSFRLGLTPTTMPLAVPAIDRMIAADANVHFVLYDGNTYQLMELLEKQIIEAAVVRTPVALNGVDSFKIAHDMMMAVSSAPMPTKITLPKILAHRLIIYRRYEKLIMEAFKEAGLSPDILCICDNARTALSLAKTGKGIALLPESMKPECTDVHISWIDSHTMETDILLVTPAGRRTILSQMFLNSL